MTTRSMLWVAVVACCGLGLLKELRKDPGPPEWVSETSSAVWLHQTLGHPASFCGFGSFERESDTDHEHGHLGQRVESSVAPWAWVYLLLVVLPTLSEQRPVTWFLSCGCGYVT